MNACSISKCIFFIPALWDHFAFDYLNLQKSNAKIRNFLSADEAL